jgi:aspartyl-tRNA(Asn)/glutamyl-tRNA(Gln) amidotransferase subunit A
MLDALAGFDERDPRTRRVPAGGYTSAVEDGVSGLRVAAISDDGGGTLGTPAVLEGVKAGLAALESAGAVIEEVAVPDMSDLWALNGVLLVIESTAYYEPFLRDRFEDIGEFARDRLLLAYSYSPLFFVKGSQARAVLRDRIENRLAGFDLVVTPGMPHEAPPLGVVEQNTRYTSVFNALGWPAIVVPTGLGEANLPVAIQIAARPWQESLVLRAGRVVERDGLWHGRIP